MLPREASMAKLKATEVAKQVALEGMQMMGGYGYASEYDMERHVRATLVDVDLRRHQRDPARDRLEDVRALAAASTAIDWRRFWRETHHRPPGFLRALLNEQARILRIGHSRRRRCGSASSAGGRRPSSASRRRSWP